MFRKVTIILAVLVFALASLALAIDKSKIVQEPATQTIQGPDFGGYTICKTYTCSPITFRYPIPDGAGDIQEGGRFNSPSSNVVLQSVQVTLRNSSATPNDTTSFLVVEVWRDTGLIPVSLLCAESLVTAGVAGPWPQNSDKIFTVPFAGHEDSCCFKWNQDFSITIRPAAHELATKIINGRLDNGTVCGDSTRWIEFGPEGPGCVGLGTSWHIVAVCFEPGATNNFFITACFKPKGSSAPALSTYGLIILALMLMVTAVWIFRKNRLATQNNLA